MDIKINLTQETLETLGVDKIKRLFNQLYVLLGENFVKIVPIEINDLGTLHYFMDISEKLEKLKHCKGFVEHAKEHLNSLTSTYFVTYLSIHLISKVEELELEPNSDKEGRKPDIKIIFEGNEFYIECKSPFSRLNYQSEHSCIEERIRENIDTPHQIDIQYYSSLSESDIDYLIKKINEKLPYVTADGEILNTPKYKVGCIIKQRTEENIPSFGVIIKITSIETYSNSYRPGHIFFRNGVSTSIAGPNVDYKDVLLKLIKKSSGQAVTKKPFVLAICINNMMGSLPENINAIKSAFQPNKNTRFTGVLLVEHLELYGSPELSKKQFIFIQNPFTKVPNTSSLNRLFKV